MRFVFASLFCLSAFAASPTRLLDTQPIRFEQPPESGGVRWTARGLGYAFAFTDQSTLLRVGDRTVRLTLEGSNPAARFQALEQTPVATNYFIGSRYASVPGFRRLRRVAVYPGIDVVYYGNGKQIEYDFEIAPGADPSRIRMHFDGADDVHLNPSGEIVLTLGDGQITQRAPVVYQRAYQRTAGNEIVAVEAAYKLDPNGTVRMALGHYDPAGALVVDPVISYTAYLTGTAADTVVAIAHDAKGFVYLAGNTLSVDFPATTDSYQSSNAGNQDAWVMKLNPAAQGGDPVIVYCSYIGGVATEVLKGMAIDSAGVFYITGSTNSSAYPVTSGALQSTVASTNNHVFVSMIDPSQSGSAGLVYSTYLAGANFEEGDAIAVAGGKIYVTGFTTSDDFPIAGAYQGARGGGYDAFVAELDPSQSGTASMIAGTFLGGSSQDVGRAIAVDAAGKVYLAGFTYSFDFPIAGNTYRASYKGDGDGFLAELDLGAGTLVYSTYLGGMFEDQIKKIVIEPSGRVALAGYTQSPDFPTTSGAVQIKFGGNGNAFLSIIDPAAQPGQGLVYSTYFGGTGGEVPYDLRRDSAGKYYLAGYTLSTDLPVTSNALNGSSAGGAVDGFIAVIDPVAANGLVYSSYVTSPGTNVVYGLDVDPSGAIYAAGMSTSNVFPQGQAVRDPTFTGKSMAFVLVLSQQ